MNKDASHSTPALLRPDPRNLISRHFEAMLDKPLENDTLEKVIDGLKKIDTGLFIGEGIADLTAKGRLRHAHTMATLLSHRAAPENRRMFDLLISQLDQRLADRTKYTEKFTSMSKENDELKRELATDPLTGIHSRKGLMQALKQALSERRRYDRGLTVAMLDLNGFKAINDTFGHETGDLALIHVAERLKDSLRATDTVGRLGGDEFMIVLPCDGRESLDEHQIREKILNAFKGMVFWDGDEPYPLTASIGLASYPPQSASAPEEPDLDILASKIMKEADIRMYEDKKNNKPQRKQAAWDDAFGTPRGQRYDMRAKTTSSLAGQSPAEPA